MALREAFATRVGMVEAIADNTTLTASERLRALDLMARYGLGTTRDVSIEDVKDRLVATIAAIRRIAPPLVAEKLIDDLRRTWR
jgi:hypothetical protein